MRSVGSGGVWLKGDVEAELLDLAGEASGVGRGILATGEVVDAEFFVGLLCGEDVPGHHEHGVRDGEDRLGLAAATEASTEALVLRAQIGGAGAGGRPGGLDHGGAQRGVALAGASGGTFAGRLMIARTQPRPGRQVRGGGKPAHVRAGPGKEHPGGPRTETGNRAEQVNRRRKGPTSTSTCASSRSIAAVRWSMWSSSMRSSSAWCSLNPPSSASRSSGIFSRIRVCAKSASTAGSRSPAISASSIARADLPITSEVGGDRVQLDAGVFQDTLHSLDLSGALLG